MARKNGVDRGILFKKGKWWVRLYVQGREEWHRCETKTQARALYGRLKSEIREGIYFPGKYRPEQETTLREWVERCLAGSSNRDRYHESHRARYWSSIWGNRALSKITAEDVRQHRAKMITSEEWEPATINRYCSALRRVLTLAVQEGKIDRHPMKGLKFLPEPQKDRFLTDDELRKVKNLLKPAAWQQVMIALGTCLRASEQFRLRWEHVSFEDSYLTIPLPKGNRTRRVPLSEEVKGTLRSLDSFLESPWVFPNPQDPLKPEDPYAVASRFKTILRKAGITGASWHTLRHTGASRLLRAGVDIVTVSKILGHSTIQTTMRYLHLVKSQTHEAVNRVSYFSIGGTTQEKVPASNRDQNRDQGHTPSSPEHEPTS